VAGWFQRIETVVMGAAGRFRLGQGDHVRGTYGGRSDVRGHVCFGRLAKAVRFAPINRCLCFGSASTSGAFTFADALLDQDNALSERICQLETYADAISVKFSQVGETGLEDMRAW
jgi:hypothetical protein